MFCHSFEVAQFEFNFGRFQVGPLRKRAGVGGCEIFTEITATRFFFRGGGGKEAGKIRLLGINVIRL